MKNIFKTLMLFGLIACMLLSVVACNVTFTPIETSGESAETTVPEENTSDNLLYKLEMQTVFEMAKEAGYTDIYNKSLITLTAFEKLMGKEKFAEILGSYVTKPAGKLTLVPMRDKRPEVTVNTVNDEFMED